MFNPKKWPREVYEPPKHYPMQLWYFLYKLNVIGFKKHDVTHMMTMLNARNIIKVPDWAFPLAVVSTAFSYITPAKRKEGNFDPDGL